MGEIAHPDFDRSVIPYSNRGQIIPTRLLVTPNRIFRPSFSPVRSGPARQLLLSDVQRASEASHNLIFVVSSRKSIKISCHSITQAPRV